MDVVGTRVHLSRTRCLAHAESVASFGESLDEDAWRRRGVYPVAGELPLLWMAANLVHEGRHHLMDVERVLETVTGG